MKRTYGPSYQEASTRLTPLRGNFPASEWATNEASGTADSSSWKLGANSIINLQIGQVAIN